MKSMRTKFGRGSRTTDQLQAPVASKEAPFNVGLKRAVVSDVPEPRPRSGAMWQRKAISSAEAARIRVKEVECHA